VRLRVLFLTSIAHFINDGSGIVYSVVYPIFTLSWGLSYTQISIVSTVMLLSSMLMSFVVGRVSDTMGKDSQMLSLGMGLWSLALGLLYLAAVFGDYAILLLSALLGGVASSFYHPLGASLISRHFSLDSSRGLALGINGSMGALGRSLYPLIATAILASPTNELFLTLPLASLLVSLLIMQLPGGNITSRNEVRDVKGLGLILAMLTYIALVKGMLPQGFITFLPTFLVKEAGYSYGIDVGLAVMIALIGSILAQPVLGAVSDRWGRGRTMLITTAMGGVVTMIYVLVYRHVVLSYVILFLFGLFSFEAFTLLLAYVSELVPAEYLSRANSIVWGIGISGGGALGPIIVGLLADHVGLGSSYEVLGAVSLTALVPIVIMERNRSSSR